MPSASRNAFGPVTCHFDVTLVSPNAVGRRRFRHCLSRIRDGSVPELPRPEHPPMRRSVRTSRQSAHDLRGGRHALPAQIADKEPSTREDPVVAAMVLITGAPGTGKSTLAEAAASRLSASVLAWDWVMGRTARTETYTGRASRAGSERFPAGTSSTGRMSTPYAGPCANPTTLTFASTRPHRSSRTRNSSGGSLPRLTRSRCADRDAGGRCCTSVRGERYGANQTPPARHSNSRRVVRLQTAEQLDGSLRVLADPAVVDALDRQRGQR
jgi:hypothetical protein